MSALKKIVRDAQAIVLIARDTPRIAPNAARTQGLVFSTPDLLTISDKGVLTVTPKALNRILSFSSEPNVSAAIRTARRAKQTEATASLVFQTTTTMQASVGAIYAKSKECTKMETTASHASPPAPHVL